MISKRTLLKAMAALGLLPSRALAQVSMTGAGPSAPGGVVGYSFNFITGSYLGGTPSIARASIGTAQDSGGTWHSFTAGQLRTSNQGLVVEGARTNLQINNTGAGITTGTILNGSVNPSPLSNSITGTPPITTLGAVSIVQGIAAWTTNVVDPVIVNSTDAVDIYWAGENATPSSRIPATNTQTFALSLFANITAGSWANTLGCKFFTNTDMWSSVPAYISTDGAAIWSGGMPINNANLGALRKMGTWTPSQAATASFTADTYLLTDATNGAAFNVTLQWGGHQIELTGTEGGFPSTYIPTSSGTVTRAADVVTLAASGYATGSVSITGKAAYGRGSIDQVLWQWDDGTENNRLRIVRDSSANLRFIATSGGVQQANLVLGTVINNLIFGVTVNWTASAFAGSLNGAAVVSTASGTVPSGLTTQRFGQDSTGNYWWGYIGTVGVNPVLNNNTWLTTNSNHLVVTIDPLSAGINGSDYYNNWFFNNNLSVSFGGQAGAGDVCLNTTAPITAPTYWEVSLDVLFGNSNPSTDITIPGVGALGVEPGGPWTPNTLSFGLSTKSNYCGGWYNGSAVFTLGSTTSNGDIISFAYIPSTKKVWVRKNGGEWNGDVIGNQNPATGTGGQVIGVTTQAVYPLFNFRAVGIGSPYVPGYDDGAQMTAKLTAASWTYAAPSGFGPIGYA